MWFVCNVFAPRPLSVAQHCDTLVQAMQNAGQTRQPGQQRYRQRALSMAHGMPLAE